MIVKQNTAHSHNCVRNYIVRVFEIFADLFTIRTNEKQAAMQHRTNKFVREMNSSTRLNTPNGRRCAGRCFGGILSACSMRLIWAVESVVSMLWSVVVLHSYASGTCVSIRNVQCECDFVGRAFHFVIMVFTRCWEYDENMMNLKTDSLFALSYHNTRRHYAG